MVKNNKTNEDKICNDQNKDLNTELMKTYYSDYPIFVVDRSPSTSECHMSKELSVPVFVLVTKNICPNPEDYRRFTFCLPPLDDIHYFYVQDPSFIQLVKSELIKKYLIRINMRKKIEEGKTMNEKGIGLEHKLQTQIGTLFIDGNIEEIFDEEEDTEEED